MHGIAAGLSGRGDEAQKRGIDRRTGAAVRREIDGPRAMK